MTAYATGHVGLNVADLDRSIDFYARVFGWDVKNRGDGYAFLGDDDRLVLTLWKQSSGTFATDQPGLHLQLILAGDTFEFLQVRLPGLSDFEWSAAAAVRRLEAVLGAHPEPIAALREFAAKPENQLTLLIGNHDFELHYRAAKQRLRRELGLSEDDGRLRFGLTYAGGGLYVDHGMQFDPWNRFARVEGISEPFEVVRGTRMVKEVINPLEDDPHARVTPPSRSWRGSVACRRRSRAGRRCGTPGAGAGRRSGWGSAGRPSRGPRSRGRPPPRPRCRLR